MQTTSRRAMLRATCAAIVGASLIGWVPQVLAQQTENPNAVKMLAEMGKATVITQGKGPRVLNIFIDANCPFPTGADGASVMLGLQNEREWLSFCDKVLLQPALAADPRFSGNARRVAARESLRQIIVEAFRELSAPQVVERLQQAQIANARVNTMHEVWEHPQLRARGRWRQIGSPVGSLPALLPPGNWDDGEPRMDPVPALGEHTESILRELGLDGAAIEALRMEQAV